MSEMPKKKSCFQITSVTQAQVAASCITDDTESLDDPDESRTEDASSEIYDVFHADLGVRERSSSKETLNINGEPQELLLPSTDPFNEGASYKIIGTGQLTASNSGGSLSGPATVPPTVSTTHSLTVINPGPAVSANVAHTASVNTNCSSRFRVIKLDHSSGEPLRRGRWMCTEFYERDSDLNIHRAVDGIKTTLTLYCSTERDSGLGTTINSVVSSTGLSLQAFENTDGAFSLEHPSHLITSEPLQQGYSLAPQLGSGSSAFHSTGYTTMPSEKLQQAQGTIQPVASQILHSYILNGVHQGALQNSPSMPPATQTQQLSYSTNGVSTGQQDYEQQHFGSSTQRPSAPSHSAWSQSSQVVSPELASASQMAQELDGEVFLARGIQLQGGNSSALAPILTGSEEQQHTNQTQSSRSFGISLASSRSSNGDVPNTFAIVTSTSLDGGLVQPQSAQVGILTSLPSSLGNHTEDHKHTSDSPPQANAVGRAGVKPLFTEGLGLATPSVNSLFGIRIAMNDDEDSTSGASVVAIDNKIEQAMDLVKSHLMYAVREEVEVLKEHIKELYERNSVLERENALLKSLASSEQLGQLSKQLTKGSNSTSSPLLQHQQQQQQQHYPLVNNNINNSISHLSQSEGAQSFRHQPNITTS